MKREKVRRRVRECANSNSQTNIEREREQEREKSFRAALSLHGLFLTRTHINHHKFRGTVVVVFFSGFFYIISLFVWFIRLDSKICIAAFTIHRFNCLAAYVAIFIVLNSAHTHVCSNAYCVSKNFFLLFHIANYKERYGCKIYRAGIF